MINAITTTATISTTTVHVTSLPHLCGLSSVSFSPLSISHEVPFWISTMSKAWCSATVRSQAHSILINPLRVRMVIFILQKRNLRLREVGGGRAQSPRAHREHSNPGWPDWRLKLSTADVFCFPIPKARSYLPSSAQAMPFLPEGLAAVPTCPVVLSESHQGQDAEDNQTLQTWNPDLLSLSRSRFVLWGLPIRLRMRAADINWKWNLNKEERCWWWKRMRRHRRKGSRKGWRGLRPPTCSLHVWSHWVPEAGPAHRRTPPQAKRDLGRQMQTSAANMVKWFLTKSNPGIIKVGSGGAVLSPTRGGLEGEGGPWAL